MPNENMEQQAQDTMYQTYTLKTGKGLIIRASRIGDETALIELMKTLDTETPFLAREPGEFNMTEEEEREFIKAALKSENKCFLVAEVEGEIIGSCSVGRPSNQKRFRHRGAMGIGLRKANWQQGIGKLMMQACIDWCKSNGIEQLELDVVTENTRALSMYKSFGFEIFGTKKHALKYGDGTYADEHFMILFMK
jgi:RimJ/RimL family protein N-acetyltransferase